MLTDNKSYNKILLMELSKNHKLSKETAKESYNKLLEYHNDNRELAKKVRDFQHDLEHYILKEITGLNKIYDQIGWLLDNKECWDRGVKIGNIPITIVSNIQNLKIWRNVAEHENKIDSITYFFHLQTMVKTINYFSNESPPEELNDMFKNVSSINLFDDRKGIKNEMILDSVIADRVRKPIVSGLNISKNTTPIAYFGNYNYSKACTISINPSDREFFDKDGNIITCDKKERLCSRKKLGRNDEDILTNNEVEIILKYCDNYFNKNPWVWFSRIEYMINQFGYSYGINNEYQEKKPCVHLNMVQWATTPFWSDIENVKVKENHIINDIYLLEYLLNNKDFEKIFINGATVARAMEQYLNIELKSVSTSFVNTTGKTINFTRYSGNYQGKTEVVGWSRPVQSNAIGGYKNMDLLYKKIINMETVNF